MLWWWTEGTPPWPFTSLESQTQRRQIPSSVETVRFLPLYRQWSFCLCGDSGVPDSVPGCLAQSLQFWGPRIGKATSLQHSQRRGQKVLKGTEICPWVSYHLGQCVLSAMTQVCKSVFISHTVELRHTLASPKLLKQGKVWAFICYRKIRKE